jgi:hypothetical protein
VFFSYEGGGRHVNLGIIITNAEYFTVVTDVFLPLENPGPAATIVAGMMGVQIAEMVLFTRSSDTHLPQVQQCGSSIHENDHRRIRGPVPKCTF